MSTNKRLGFMLFYAFFAGNVITNAADRLDEGKPAWLHLLVLAGCAWRIYDGWQELKRVEVKP